MKSKLYRFLIILVVILFYSFPIESKLLPKTEKYFKKSIELFKLGDYEKSKSRFQKLAGKYPLNALFWFNLGNTYFMLNDYNEAISSYKKVVELSSSLSLPSNLYIIKAYRNLEKCRNAAQTLSNFSNVSIPPGIEAELENEKELISQCLLMSGLNKYKNEQYNESISDFDAVLAFSDNEKAEMMRGLALLEVGDSLKAKLSFTKILTISKSADFDDEFINFAQHFVKEIDDGKWMLSRDYMLRLFMAAGFNSNAYRTGERGDVLARPYLSLNLDSAYKFIGKKSFSSFIYYSFLYEEILGFSDLRYIENILSLPLIFHKESLLFKINPVVNYSILEDESFVLKSGSQLLFQYGKKYKIGTTYSYLRNFSPGNTYKYLEGNYHEVSVFGAYTGRDFIFKPGFRFFDEDTGDLVEYSTILPLANMSYGPTLFFNWMISQNWTLKINNIFLIRKFDNISAPGNVQRNDKQWQGDVRVSRVLKNNVSTFLNLTTTVNISNLESGDVENKNYYQIIAFLGFSWDVFK